MRTRKGRKVKYTKLSDEKLSKINPARIYLVSLKNQPNKPETPFDKLVAEANRITATLESIGCSIGRRF